MNKVWYVSSGSVQVEIEAPSRLDACKTIIRTLSSGEKLGLIMRVSDKGFKGDHNPWYVSTEAVIEAVGQRLECE